MRLHYKDQDQTVEFLVQFHQSPQIFVLFIFGTFCCSVWVQYWCRYLRYKIKIENKRILYPFCFPLFSVAN